MMLEPEKITCSKEDGVTKELEGTISRIQNVAREANTQCRLMKILQNFGYKECNKVKEDNIAGEMSNIFG